MCPAYDMGEAERDLLELIDDEPGSDGVDGVPVGVTTTRCARPQRGDHILDQAGRWPGRSDKLIEAASTRSGLQLLAMEIRFASGFSSLMPTRTTRMPSL